MDLSFWLLGTLVLPLMADVHLITNQPAATNLPVVTLTNLLKLTPEMERLNRSEFFKTTGPTSADSKSLPAPLSIRLRAAIAPA